ncbi:MAG: UDP-N-acetylmuramoylalanine--D-glutamate ligase [Parcubacteria group bacterium Gr01-1014_8]|nr:MAG: UDP-N-acetylmuramoylalanine--D-glutamate ligase [Parcubacteria group bacterium Gr01-1014_8]
MTNKYQSFFAGKRITMLGLGLLGRGVGDAEFITPLCKELLITDRKSEDELRGSVARLKKHPNITFRLGEQREEDFTNCDMVIKAAGVPLDSPYIAAAKKAGVPVYMSTALFAKFAKEMSVTIVGITGTRGKSTVVHLIYHALHEAGKRAHLGGNIRGVSTLALLPKMQKGDIAILELDSWQLQGFGDLQISPHIAVFTNLMPDHLNYYPDMETYFNDKANIFKYQKKGDVLIAGDQVEQKILRAQPTVDPLSPLLSKSIKLKILGEHNRENAALAAAALDTLGLSEEVIHESLGSFRGIEGRLQYLGETQGVKIYNDNNATTPEATIAALRALGDGKNIVLIIGGDDKNLDMSKLVEEIPKWCKGVVMFKERGTDRIREQVLAMKGQKIDVYEEKGLEATVKRAFSVAKEGETLLFSPAFSSFGRYFKNEFDRGDQFVQLVDAHVKAG